MHNSIKKAHYTIAVDTGNTRTSIALVNLETLCCSNRKDILNDNFTDDFSFAIDQLLNQFSSGSLSVHISSCISSIRIEAVSICRSRGVSVNSVRAHDHLPVHFRYKNPKTLGSDRVADALACNRLFSGKDCIIVDSGTTITIDYLRGGIEFLGGTILPGVAMQLLSLTNGTAALPYLESPDQFVATPPGDSTSESIASGVLFGTAGAISAVINRYRDLSLSEPVVAVTGGAWNLTSRFITTAYTHIPDLTLIGAALYTPEPHQDEAP